MGGGRNPTKSTRWLTHTVRTNSCVAQVPSTSAYARQILVETQVRVVAVRGLLSAGSARERRVCVWGGGDFCVSVCLWMLMLIEIVHTSAIAISLSISLSTTIAGFTLLFVRFECVR